MNVVQSALTSSRFNRVFAWLAAGVLVAGIGFGIYKVSTRGGGPAKHFNVPPETATPKPINLNASVMPFKELDPDVQQLTKNFLVNAVAQKNLGQAWFLVDQTLRNGSTHNQWKHGTTTVIPVPFDSLKDVKFLVKTANPREINIQANITPSKSSGIVQAQTMYLGLKKFGTGSGSHWLVDNWGSVWNPPLPFVPNQ